jgi:hypothetical protein
MEGFNSAEERGIIPRAIEQIFKHIQTTLSPRMRFLVRASYLQIYNEVISDLLKPERSNLVIREDKKKVRRASIAAAAVALVVRMALFLMHSPTTPSFAVGVLIVLSHSMTTHTHAQCVFDAALVACAATTGSDDAWVCVRARGRESSSRV